MARKALSNEERLRRTVFRVQEVGTNAVMTVAFGALFVIARTVGIFVARRP
jgi:hypothetical protein